MADYEDSPDRELLEELEQEGFAYAFAEDDNDPLERIENLYQLWWEWADFHIFIIDPVLPAITPAIIIPPELIDGTSELEFVYNIHDSGNKLSTSKAVDMYTAGMSMCKLFYTIEKMIQILIDRLDSEGIDKETEVQIAFGGHQIAQRKGFESVINLDYNVVVTNFDPDTWGTRHMATLKRLVEKGFPPPTKTPRDLYRRQRGSPTRRLKT